MDIPDDFIFRVSVEGPRYYNNIERNHIRLSTYASVSMRVPTVFYIVRVDEQFIKIVRAVSGKIFKMSSSQNSYIGISIQ